MAKDDGFCLTEEEIERLRHKGVQPDWSLHPKALEEAHGDPADHIELSDAQLAEIDNGGEE